MRTSTLQASGKTGGTARARVGAGGFTLVELLVVISIIALLISILVPSLNNARNQAKALQVSALISAVEKSLEQFKTENEREFRSTNGYPPSYWDESAQADPFLRGEDQTLSGEQSLFGAQWLVRHLMGADLAGFVPKRNVPSNLRKDGDDAGDPTTFAQKDWYSPQPPGLQGPLDRVGPYLDGSKVELATIPELTGGPTNSTFFPDGLNPVSNPELLQPVIVDVWGRPILYYVANPLAKTMASLSARGEPGSTPPGIYYQADNAGFTGFNTGTSNDAGWNFGSGDHPLGKFPSTVTSTTATDGLDLGDVLYLGTFVGTIYDRNAYKVAGVNPSGGQPRPEYRHQPYNRDTYLLISAGLDGRYGTPDDIKNFKVVD